jgi:hypothetical protein
MAFLEVPYSRFCDGSWMEGSWNPSSWNTTVTMSAEQRLSHKFGADLTDRFPEIYMLRKLPKADVTMPVYYWASSKPTNYLIRDHECFRNGIGNFINGLPRSVIETGYSQASGAEPRIVRIEFSREQPLNLLFGPSSEDLQICLGHVAIRPGTDPYWGQGYIELRVSKNGETYEILDGPNVVCTLEDVFDFNYFSTGYTSLPPQDGASIQCGFGRSGSIQGAGQVAIVRIDVSGIVNVGPFTK